MSVDLMIQRLFEMEEIRRPILKRMISSLNLPVSSRGLDIGCGIGLQSLTLAEVVGPEGRITGVDINAEVLKVASCEVAKANLATRIDFQQGSFMQLPFEDQTFDWVWSADCVGYPTGEMALVIPEMLRVIKPGGRLFLTGWTSQQLLPGYPLLEAKLNAEYSAYAPYLRGVNPENHFSKLLHWFQKYGLNQAKASTFTMDLQAPLNVAQQKALASLFEMLWVKSDQTPISQPWDDDSRLCKPTSKDFLPAKTDYYGYFTYSLFQAVNP